jgi:hypothetical protein
MVRTMYHTQERRRFKLSFPVKCYRSDAWLGEGYYFWYYLDDAHYWGFTSKTRTGYYEIYSADIDCEDVLDTVFNEEHYLFWIKQIELAIAYHVKRRRDRQVTLKDINDYFVDKKLLEGVKGVMFQDISNNPSSQFVGKFQYRKRIQIAVYDEQIIANFVFVEESKC